MARIFQTQFEKGSLIDKMSGSAMTNTATVFKRTEKGIAAEFDGSSSELLKSPSGIGTAPTKISVSIFVKSRIQPTTTEEFFFSLSNNTVAGSTGLELAYTTSGILTAYYVDQSASLRTISDSVSSVGEWKHVVFTYDESVGGELFVDSVSVGTASANGGLSANQNQILLGGFGTDFPRYFDGQMGSVNIYDHALTQDEINKEYEAFLKATNLSETKRNYSYYKPESLDENGLVCAFNMIPSEGGVLTDISNSGNNGAIDTGITGYKRGLNFPLQKDIPTTYEATDQDMTIMGTATVYSAGASTWGSVWSIGNYLMGLSVYSSSLFFASVANGVNKIFAGTLASLNGKEFTYSCIYRPSTGLKELWINGVQVGTDSTDWGANPGQLIVGGQALGRNLKQEQQDFRLYNRALSAQEAKDYHNKYANQVYLKDYLEYEKADGTNLLPEGWNVGTGSYKIGELAIEQGDLVTNGTFDTDTDWVKDVEWTIGGGTANCDGTQVGIVSIRTSASVFSDAKRYRITLKILNRTAGGLAIASNAVLLTSFETSNGTFSYDLTWPAGTNKLLYFYGNVGFDGSIDNVSVVEIPPLPNFDTGTKYLQCTSAGTIAFQSKQAYGTWEFDVYKGADANVMLTEFISSGVGGYASVTGYMLNINQSELIALQKMNATGSPSGLFSTAASYIANNTDYRIKIERLVSSGVFKDIPTLQVSDLENGSGANAYTTFTNASRYGFSAISNGSGVHVAGTADEISIVNTENYLIEFDLELNSGTAPRCRLREAFTGTGISNTVVATSGRNSFILTATGTATGVLRFSNENLSTDYTISNLRISQIYDPGTFAVFISGGSFGDTYTLVDVSGGSGTNPVTDNTHTTSNFSVLDLDVGDRMGRFLYKKGIQQ